MDPVLSSYTTEFLLAVVLGVILYYFRNPFNFWKNRNVPYLKPSIPILGNISMLVAPVEQMALDFYNAFPKEKFIGSFTLWRPSLVVRDPELIETILIKEFSHFYNRNNVVDIETNILSKHLVNYHDEKWKALRNKLTPTFTTGKLKGMHPQLVHCAQAVVDYMSKTKSGEALEMKDLCGRYSMDVITSCAFGLDLDIINNPDSEFLKIGRRTFAPNYFVRFFFSLQAFLSPLYKKLGLGLIPKNMTDFFTRAVDQTLEYREKNNVTRPDFLHLLNELKKHDEELIKKKELDPKDPVAFDYNSLVSNAFVFFAAGYETTATTLSYLFYELALNSEIQEKVYEEISSVTSKHNGEMTFEAINEMMYLEHVISETLRKHPPGVMLDRKVTKDYVIPGTDLLIPAGISVLIPVYGLHHDPQYFPEPEKFIPERFDTEKNSITKGTYLPFGAGPRICIAARFAKMETKVLAAMVLNNFKIKTCSKTVIPVQYDRRSFLLVPKGGIHLSVEKRPVQVAR